MNEATYRILDVVSRNLGIPMPISEITKSISEIHARAYYSNTYERIKELEEEEILTLTNAGRSSLVSLNFDNYMTIGILAEMELRRKHDFLKERQEMQMLMLESDTRLRNVPLMSHMMIMHPKKNAALNKAEMLICLKASDDKKALEETKIRIHATAATLQRARNVRVDCMVLDNQAFVDLLKSNEYNAIREILYDKIVMMHPQDFWLEIKCTLEKGYRISTMTYETAPVKISERDVAFNLARFGYTEISPEVKLGRSFCLEYVITSILFHNNARRIDAIPVIIAKNPRTSYDLLLFLTRKYGFDNRILGILRALRYIVTQELGAVDEMIRILEATGTEEISANANSIKEKLKLYNVT